jgi:hypothetical protein
VARAFLRARLRAAGRELVLDLLETEQVWRTALVLSGCWTDRVDEQECERQSAAR